MSKAYTRGTVKIEVDRAELGMLEEAVSHLMPTKRGPKLTALLKLRTRIAQELAMLIEEEEENGR